MNTKKEQREAALKKAKKKRVMILTGFAACVVAIVAFALLVSANRLDSRVFAAAGQTVTLYEDGRFRASFPVHGVTMSGAFEEHMREDGSIIVFNHQGQTIATQIIDDVFMLPFEWWMEGCCGNIIEFPLQR